MAEYISFQPSAHYNTKLYTGNNGTQSITTGSFGPDFTWIKRRGTSAQHCLFDVIRGATNVIQTSTNEYQQTFSNTLTSFDSAGFSLGDYSSVNASDTFASWNWKMGTTTGIAGSPSITPTAYSFNATAGQSIIEYTGTGVAATLPHGLGAAPAFIIVKNLTVNSRDWYVYHQYLGNTQRIYLNQNTAATTSSTGWNDTSPTSTLFSIGTNEAVNETGATLIAYCFAEKKGYSKFSSYWGNGQSSDGTFVYTGFRPAWILTKKTTGSVDWWMFDDQRIGYNPNQYRLLANQISAETSTGYVDFLSNGFKWRSSDGDINGSGDTFIYAAFSEFPTVSSNDIPVTAR